MCRNALIHRTRIFPSETKLRKLRNPRLNAKLSLISALVGILIFSSVAFSLSSNNATIYSSGTIVFTSPLRVVGTQLVNALGQTVYLRGVDALDFLETSTGDFLTEGQAYGAASLSWSNASVVSEIQDWQSHGFNFIRALIPCDWWLKNSAITFGGATTPIGLRTAFTYFVQIAEQHGIYVEICPWEIVGYPESGPPAGLPWSTPNQNVITTQQQFVQFWAGNSTSVANVLGSYPNVLFNLFNEPQGNEATWMSAAQDCVNAIRNVCQTCVIVQYGYCSGFKFVTDYPLNGTNIIYDQHIYRNFQSSLYQGTSTILGVANSNCAFTLSDVNATLLTADDYSAVVGHYCFMCDEVNLCDTTDAQAGNDPYSQMAWINTLYLLDHWNASYAAWFYGPGQIYSIIQGSTFPFSLTWDGQILSNAIKSPSVAPPTTYWLTLKSTTSSAPILINETNVGVTTTLTTNITGPLFTNNYTLTAPAEAYTYIYNELFGAANLTGSGPAAYTGYTYADGPYTMSSSATVSGAYFYAKGKGHVMVAIYTAVAKNVSGFPTNYLLPGSLVVASSSTAVSADTWNLINFTSTTLPAGSYYIAFQVDENGIAASEGAPTMYAGIFASDPTYGAFSSTFGTIGGSISGSFNIYIPSKPIQVTTYSFVKWENGATNPTRLINLNSSVNVTASYTLTSMS